MYNNGNSSKNVTGSSVVDGTVEAADLATAVNTDIADGVAGKATADLALPKAGGAMTGAITTNSTFDGVDVATRDGVLTTTTATANDALPKAGGTMTGTIEGFTSTGIDDNATSTAITIDANENVGIGISNPSGIVHIKGDTDGLGPDLRLQVNNANTWDNIGVIRFGNNSNSDLVRIQAVTATTSTSGYLAIQTSTSGTLSENVRFPSEGGMTFNGDTAAANALDDYEEGTFTPTLLGSGSNPTVTYSNQSGKYTKIGRLVTINIYLSTSDYSGGSGNIRIGGLPFAAANENPESTGFIMGFRVNTAAEAAVSINAGESYAQILARTATDTSTGWGNASVGIWTAANPTIAKVCITYET
jgi:hypothetical protein